MHIQTNSVSSLLIVLALLASGCSKGSIGNTKPAPDSAVGDFVPASAEDDRPEESDPAEQGDEVVEGDDGDDGDVLDAGAPVDSGAAAEDAAPATTAPVDSGVADSAPAADTAPVDTGATVTPTTPPPTPISMPHACDGQTTLTDFIGCIAARMPTSGSDRYRVPTAVEKLAWRAAVKRVMAGACDFAVDPALSTIARVKTFKDAANGRTYCVLSEAQPAGKADRGLGTFVFDKSAERELVHAAPHPFTDKNTEKEALEIFRTTKSRAYLLSGTYRDASNTTSACQSSYRESDPAHHTDHLFQAVTEELAGVYGDDEWTIIEWHGMREEQCPGENVYMTYGVEGLPPASSALLALRDAIRAQRPEWKVYASGESDCSMAGTSNVQGRWLNHFSSSASVCNDRAPAPSGRMMHVEQHPDYRIAADWAIAVAKAFPAAPRHKAAPLAPTNVSISGTTVRFERAHRATSYTVEEITSAGSRVIATASSTTATIPSGVKCVTVTANGTYGKSPRSKQACN